MKAITRRAWVPVLILSSCLPATRAFAETRNLATYPCDVIMESACLRLPQGMSVRYEVPADSGIYAISLNGTEILSAYVGSAPGLPEKKPSLKLSAPGADLRGYLEPFEGKTRVDVVIVPRHDSDPTVHLYGDFTPNQRSSVATVLSGLRFCRHNDRETWQCAAISPWGSSLLKWMESTP